MLARGCFLTTSLIKAGSGVSIGGARQVFLRVAFPGFQGSRNKIVSCRGDKPFETGENSTGDAKYGDDPMKNHLEDIKTWPTSTQIWPK